LRWLEQLTGEMLEDVEELEGHAATYFGFVADSLTPREPSRRLEELSEARQTV
jgi:hypothetical protein